MIVAAARDLVHSLYMRVVSTVYMGHSYTLFLFLFDNRELFRLIVCMHSDPTQFTILSSQRVSRLV